MKYGVRKTSRYKKSLKKMLRRGKDIKKITDVVRLLANGEVLPPQYKDHPLVNIVGRILRERLVSVDAKLSLSTPLGRRRLEDKPPYHSWSRGTRDPTKRVIVAV